KDALREGGSDDTDVERVLHPFGLHHHHPPPSPSPLSPLHMDAALSQLTTAALLQPSLSFHRTTQSARSNVPVLVASGRELSKAATAIMGTVMDLEDARRYVRELREARTGAKGDGGGAGGGLKSVHAWLQRAIRS